MADRRVIFINGIQSSGKSSVTRKVAEKAPSFRVLTGDEIVRSVPESQRLAQWQRLFALTLDTIDEWLESTHVIMDGAWTEAQVREAQERFGDAGLFVVLRIDEKERRRREGKRRDRQIAYWDPAWHNMPGPDDIYDLVLDSKKVSIDECAHAILAAAREKWAGLEI